jgi:hypothetical protein
MPRFNSVASIVVLLTAFARASEPTYVIHFDEADHRGDRATFERSSATVIHTSTKFDDQDEPRESETTIGMQLRGDWEVLNADPAAASSTAESMIVRSWTRKVQTNGKVITDKEVLPPGTKVIARLSGDETKYTVRNDDADEESEPPTAVESILPGVLALHNPRGRTRDAEMFGGTRPRKVGESWPVDAQAAAKVYSQNQLEMEPKDITGTVKLLGVQTYNGRECLHVAVDMEVANFRMLPTTREARNRDNDDDGYKNKSALMTSHAEWLIDAAGDEKHYASFSTVRKYRGEGTVRNDKHYVMDETVRMETRIRRLAGSRAGAATTKSATTSESD